MQHSRVAAHIVFGGPMRANCEKHMAYEWAHTRACTQDTVRLLLANLSLSATSVHWHHWPMRANCKKTYVA